MYPTTLAVIALTFSSYVLQPVFPNCVPPYMATRMLSITCLCKCVYRLQASAGGTDDACSSDKPTVRIQLIGKLGVRGEVFSGGGKPETLFMFGVNNAKHPFRREDSRATRRVEAECLEAKAGDE